jgi:hypothetical protein
VKPGDSTPPSFCYQYLTSMLALRFALASHPCGTVCVRVCARACAFTYVYLVYSVTYSCVCVSVSPAKIRPLLSHSLPQLQPAHHGAACSRRCRKPIILVTHPSSRPIARFPSPLRFASHFLRTTAADHYNNLHPGVFRLLPFWSPTPSAASKPVESGQ